MKTFIEKYNILSSCQYGFRSQGNTANAVFNLSNYIAENFDKGINTAGLFTDFCKAFDSLSHAILLKKTPCLRFQRFSSLVVY